MKPKAQPGRFLLRLPKDLHLQVKDKARAQGVSMNMYIVTCLAGCVQKKRKG